MNSISLARFRFRCLCDSRIWIRQTLRRLRSNSAASDDDDDGTTVTDGDQPLVPVDQDGNGQLPDSYYQRYFTHVPVMARETVQALKPLDGQIYFDMTFGGGGHTKHLLATQRDIRVIAMDRDPEAYKRAIALSEHDERVIPLLGRFSEFPELFKKLRIGESTLSGVIMDLGASSYQLDDKDRGFSYGQDGPLDMRMDGRRFPNMPTAADVLNTLDSDSLAKIFKVYGDEKYGKKYAQAIIDLRFMMHSISTTTGQLSQLINSLRADIVYDALGRPSSACAKVFQALRIFVNNEINELNYALEHIHRYLVFDPKTAALQRINEYEQFELDETLNAGKISVLSFHSIEDRLVKRHLTAINIDDPLTETCSQQLYNALEVVSADNIDRLRNRKWFCTTKHVVKPSEEEVLSNTRSRSAKLRTAVRI